MQCKGSFHLGQLISSNQVYRFDMEARIRSALFSLAIKNEY